MALSNYDMFVMNHKGESCRGEFVSPLGIKVKAYKDWLYVEDSFGWQKEGGHAEPTIMEINSSRLIYKDVNIACIQRSTKHCDITTLFCIWSGWEHEDTLTGVIGICQYGDIQPDAINELHETLITNFGCEYCTIPETFKLFDLSSGKRCNQGDMFFHDKIGTDAQCTVPGKAKNTMFGQLLGFKDSD